MFRLCCEIEMMNRTWASMMMNNAKMKTGFNIWLAVHLKSVYFLQQHWGKVAWPEQCSEDLRLVRSLSFMTMTKQLSAVVFANSVLLCQVPVAVANCLIDWGATSTEHKLAGLIHMTKTETGGGDVYDAYNKSVIALVTDQGKVSYHAKLMLTRPAHHDSSFVGRRWVRLQF